MAENDWYNSTIRFLHPDTILDSEGKIKTEILPDDIGVGGESAYEIVSKNLRTYPYTLTYGVDGISTIVYDLGEGLSITKTFNYTSSVLTSIVLSGDTPSNIELTKTLVYTGADLTSVTYS
jgi:hypothetical protein